MALTHAERERNTKARWTNPETGRVVKHPYERSVFSGAGNCWCGRVENSSLHLLEWKGQKWPR